TAIGKMKATHQSYSSHPRATLHLSSSLLPPPPPPRPPLFPYTTLFRSRRAPHRRRRSQLPGLRRFVGPDDPRSRRPARDRGSSRSEEHTSELQSRFDLVCRLLLEKKNTSVSYSIRCI